VKLSQQQYDAMLLGVYQLIQAKTERIRSLSEYIEALRDYWIARSDLERAVGTRLTTARPTPCVRPIARRARAAPAAPTPAPSHGAHQH